jgi:membrane protease YdiL (CAAX protease family)
MMGTPAGLAADLLLAPERRFFRLGLLWMQALAVMGLAGFWLERTLARGVVAVGLRETGRKARPFRAEVEASAPGRASWLSPVKRRELRLLARDRNFLIQTLLMPIVMVGLQFALRANREGGISLSGTEPRTIAALGFGIAAYTLMYSAFQTINAEGQALWLLYTIPRSLAGVLRDKAVFWGAVAIGFAAALFVAAGISRGGVDGPTLVLYLLAFSGVPIFAVIATSLGIFAARPLAPTPGRRIRLGHLYFYFLLSGLYTYTLYADGLWRRGALLLLIALLAFALWQKATDKLPYLLDPTAAPAAAVSLADGMLAAIFFLVLQPLLGWLFSGYFHKEQAVLVAFVAAGALTAAGARHGHGLRAARGAPRFFDPRGGRALLYGLFGGVVAAALGALYVIAYHRVPWLRELLRPQTTTELEAGWWLAALAIFAAPLFEEFIFRGLVFTGLRRSLPLPVAVLASAAVFAVVHPPASALPVGLLGIICAVVYDRTGLLIAPMLTHAVYNAAIVALQM